MCDHVHLLLTPADADSAGMLMKRLGQRYVQYINCTYRRSSTLWEGRFRSCIAQEEAYLPACQRSIELNPVRAGIVAHPGECRWSSYACNGQGEKSDLLSPHSIYLYLSRSAKKRQASYRELLRHEREPGISNQIRQAINGNFALGNARFTEEIAARLGRRVTPGKAGRPPKKTKRKETNE